MNVSCATVADDFYHTYGTDIALMRDMSLGAFRMSLSWSRLMTWNGTRMVANQVREQLLSYPACCALILPAHRNVRA